MLKVFLLGRFAIERDGQPVMSWGGRQARDLVKVLATAAGQPLTRDQLVDALWDEDEPPAQAERDLKVVVSRARRALGDAAHAIIVTTATGYAFTERGWVDAEEMARLIGQAAGWERAGRPALAEASYREALRLYRGPLLAENLYADWTQPARERYHRLHLDATLALGGLLQRRGDPEALALAERLLAADPYADTALQAVLVARATTGDASAALDAYARFRRRLRDDLGASPSPATEAMHAALLRAEPPGEWPRSRSAGLPAAVAAAPDGPLVGRHGELGAMEEALERVAAGRAELLVLTGEAGIGKSRLLASLKGLAGGRFRLLAAAGKERERHLPFQLLAEALRSLDAGPEELRAAAGPYADAIADLVPEAAPLAAPFVQDALRSASPIARRRVLEGCVHILRSLAERRPVLVVLDDGQWADPSTCDAVTFCLRRLGGCGVLWALALRSGEPAPAALDELTGAPGAQVIEVGPLTPADVRRLVGSLAPDVADRIVAESAGVPFYVVQFLSALAEGGDPGATGATAVLPSGIRRAVRERVQRVPARAKRVLVAAAVLGDGFGVEAVGALADLPPGVALDAIDDLVVRRLLAVGGPRASGFRFAHDLIRRAVYDGIDPPRRRYLHGRAADLGIGGGLAVVGGHAWQAGRPDQAARLLVAAGDEALARLATREAEELFEAALRAAQEARRGRPASDAQDALPAQVDLLDRLGRARAARGDYGGAATAQRAALGLAGDGPTAARQKVRLGWLAYWQHEPARAAALGRDAEAGADGATRGEALLLQAKVAHNTGAVAQAAPLLVEASRLVGPEARAEAQALDVTMAHHRGRYSEAVLRFDGAAVALRRGGLFRPLTTLLLHAGLALAGRGEYVRALAILGEGAALCRQAGVDLLLARVPNALGSVYHQLGEPGRAGELNAESLELAARTGMAEAHAHTLLNLAELALDAGDTALARRHLDRAQHVIRERLVYLSWRAALRWRLGAGRLALREGRTDEARWAAQALLNEAKATASPKYEVLSLLLRGEARGPADRGQADLRAALELARCLDARPLIWTAALALSRALTGSEADAYARLARDTAEVLAGPLPDDLRRSFIARLDAQL